MADKKKNSGKTGGKVGKVFLWIFAVVGILVVLGIIAAFIWVGNSDETISNYQVLDEQYRKAFDSFSTEYGIADPAQVTSLSTLPRAKEAVINAEYYLGIVETNLTAMSKMIADSKSDYSEDKLTWAESAEKCDASELARVNLYKEILANEKVYLSYFENDKNYELTYDEFAQILDSYSYNVKMDNEQAIINDLNKLREKTILLKQHSEAAYKAIPFEYYRKASLWAGYYLEALDLEIKYRSSPSTDLLKQMNDKYDNSVKALSGVTINSVKEEFDKWYNEKITSNVDKAEREFNNGDQYCSKAGDLFATAFPGNANVVAEVNSTQ